MRLLVAVTRAFALTWLATSFVRYALADEVTGTEPAEESIDEIIVTGSRLPLNPTVPVTILSRHDIARGGANSLGDVLQALPMNAGSPLNTNVNISGEPIYGDYRGDGSVRVALRGHATLVLLNGRRFLNSGAGADTSVDLNTLPISFVDRVEVLPSGASAIYGSDAVGGVINVITRRDMVGLTLAGSQALAEHGDGAITTGQVAAGLDLLGGTWFLGIEKVKQEGVTLDRRSYSAVPLVIIDTEGTQAPFSNRATGEGRFAVPGGNVLGLQPGAYTRVDGATGRTAADYRLIDPVVDFFNVAPFHYSQTPNERGAFWLIGSLPLSERTDLIVEGLVDHRQSTQASAPDPYFGGVAPTLADGSLGIPADSFYNPFGVDLARNGPPVIERRLVELGNRRFSEEVDLWRVLTGLEGRVADWLWTLSVAGAASDASTLEAGTFFRSRMALAVGPSGPDDTGRIVCGSPDPATRLVPAQSVIPGCVPLDLFGGPGSISREQLDYVSPGTLVHSGTNEERTAELVLRGPWGQLADREFEWVLGAAYRRDSGSFVTDPKAVAENSESDVLTGGAYESRELFAEVQVPLLHDRRWAKELALNLAVRRSDSSAFDDHRSWQAGLHWQPLDDWTVRANYADVFNEPELWALHDPRIRIFGFELDPCGNEPTPEEQVNCAADGVPGGAYAQTEDEFEIVAGGNPNLEPETGFSIGAGLEYTPRWAEGLSLSVDYFHLEISNLISQLDVDRVLRECAAHGLSKVCDDIERFPDGNIRRVATFNENFGGLFDTRGVDFAIDWTSTEALGELNATLLATYLERWDEQPFLEGSLFEHAGKFDAGAMPRWRGLGTLDLVSGPVLAAYSVEYIGSYTQTVFPPRPAGDLFEEYSRGIEPVLYHDIEGQYEFGNGFTLRAAITNLTNEDPPYVNLASAANTDPGTYRLLGRTYFLELRYDFARRSE